MNSWRRTIRVFLLAGCGDGDAFRDPSRAFGPEVAADAPVHPTRIHLPETLGVADGPVRDVNGLPVGVACDTCHGPDPYTAWVNTGPVPDDIHGSIELEHGSLTCDFCHDPEDRSLLHLADGSTIPFSDTMQLCAQCHGVQHRDYVRGSHGGMVGYWDTRRGARDRNHCVDCHAPHAPAYGAVMPVLPPRDRYLRAYEPEGH